MKLITKIGIVFVGLMMIGLARVCFETKINIETPLVVSHTTVVPPKPLTDSQKIELTEQNKLNSIRRAIEQKEANRKDTLNAFCSSVPGFPCQMERIIKNSMNDPDSYILDSVNYAPSKDRPELFLIQVKWRGKNKFGGYVRSETYFTLDTDKNIYVVVSQTSN